MFPTWFHLRRQNNKWCFPLQIHLQQRRKFSWLNDKQFSAIKSTRNIIQAHIQGVHIFSVKVKQYKMDIIIEITQLCRIGLFLKFVFPLYLVQDTVLHGSVVPFPILLFLLPFWNNIVAPCSFFFLHAQFNISNISLSNKEPLVNKQTKQMTMIYKEATVYFTYSSSDLLHYYKDKFHTEQDFLCFSNKV